MMALEETARLAERSVIALAVPFRRWAEELDRSPNFQIQPYTMEILFESVSLRSLRDPGDRAIVATARHLRCPLSHRRLNDSPRKVDRDALGLASESDGTLQSRVALHSQTVRFYPDRLICRRARRQRLSCAPVSGTPAGATCHRAGSGSGPEILFNHGAISSTDGKYVRYRRGSRVRSRCCAIAAWAPM